jgi:hypothetical protein
VRKLVTTAANADFESLQYLHSAGAWDPEGTRFTLATVRKGRPALMILPIDDPGAAREIPIPELDEVYSPTWSPDGRAIGFSAMSGGVTDLFVLDMKSETVRRLTDDPYADLQPSWSPDGRTLAFATDRFSTDLNRLRFGAYGIGLMDVASGSIAAAPGIEGANQLDPAWSPDGASLFFVADPDGVTNVFRMQPADGRVYQVTNVRTGVSGVTRLSPSISVASSSGALAVSVYRRSGYEIHAITSASELEGTLFDPVTVSVSNGSAAGELAEADGPIDPVPLLSPPPATADVPTSRSYRPKLSLEAVGSPYFSAGGGPVGGYVQGGASLLFGDLLGDRQLLTAVHVSSRFDESAFGAMYIDRTSRWNWGVTLEQMPEVRLRTLGLSLDPDRERVVTRDRERRIWTHRHLGGFVAYPLNRSQRIEFSAGLRQITFDRERRTELVSAITGQLIDEETRSLGSEPSIGLMETGVALVGDTAIFGATGPLLGTRYRFQVSPAVGGLSYTSILADYRRYVMPLRPFTLAVRVVHSGRYGKDAGDFRLRDVYLGSPSLVRGYGASAVSRSECPGGSYDCPALNTLIASRLAVAKVELRVPLSSTLSSRIRYGVLPMDAFFFADAGAGWGGEARFGTGGSDGKVIKSVGAGVRMNVIGLLFEVAGVKPLDLQDSGWSFAFNLRPGF